MTLYKRPTIHMPNELYEKIIKYQHSENLSSFSEAINWLTEIAFTALSETIPESINPTELNPVVLAEVERLQKYNGWSARKQLQVLFENCGDLVTENELQKIAELFNRQEWWIKKTWVEIKSQYFNAS